jgi:Phage tail lysozyme
MQTKLFSSTLAISALVAINSAVAVTPPPPIESPLPINTIKYSDRITTPPVDVSKITTPKKLICIGCNDYENITLNFLQERGITDKYALATLLGNIKQESMFIPNICEGGARTSYEGCTAGGYGLIQWTSIDRYKGLGQFAKKYGGSPSNLKTQLSYMVTEEQWQRIEAKLKTPGKPIERYMNYAYSWLGWGIHGARTNFAYDYSKRLVYSDI